MTTTECGDAVAAMTPLKYAAEPELPAPEVR
jgi:hypothetical protein